MDRNKCCLGPDSAFAPFTLEKNRTCFSKVDIYDTAQYFKLNVKGEFYKFTHHHFEFI